jgi:hypothetical protein
MCTRWREAIFCSPLFALARPAIATPYDRVEAAVAQERGKNHHILADRLQRALNAVSVTSPAARQPTAQLGKDTILETIPRRRLDELILPLPVGEQARQLIEEQCRADLLRAHGMQPRHRVLLSGPLVTEKLRSLKPSPRQWPCSFSRFATMHSSALTLEKPTTGLRAPL